MFILKLLNSLSECITHEPFLQTCILIGVQSTSEVVAITDLKNVRQLDNLMRAYTLLAKLAGSSDYAFKDNLAMAAACVVQMWKVR